MGRLVTRRRTAKAGQVDEVLGDMKAPLGSGSRRRVLVLPFLEDRLPRGLWFSASQPAPGKFSASVGCDLDFGRVRKFLDQ